MPALGNHASMTTASPMAVLPTAGFLVTDKAEKTILATAATARGRIRMAPVRAALATIAKATEAAIQEQISLPMNPAVRATQHLTQTDSRPSNPMAHRLRNIPRTLAPPQSVVGIPATGMPANRTALGLATDKKARLTRQLKNPM